jgi:hypothetical protein
MRRLIQAALLIAGLLTAAGVRPLAARASHLPVLIKTTVFIAPMEDLGIDGGPVPTDASADVTGVFPSIVAPVNSGLNEEYARLQPSLPAWKCVGAVPDDVALPKVAITGYVAMVHNFQVADGDPEGRTALFVGVKIEITGQNRSLFKYDDQFTYLLSDQDTVIAFLKQRAQDLLAGLMGSASPCSAGGKLHASAMSKSSDMFPFTQTFTTQTDIDLSLDKEGSLDTTVPVTVTFATQDPHCSTNLIMPAVQLHIMGSYRDSDDSLVLSTMELRGVMTPTGSLRCNYGDLAGICTVQAAIACVSPYGASTDPGPDAATVTFDITGGSPVKLALKDGASLALPLPDSLRGAGVTWDGTLALTYPAGGAAVASRPDVAVLAP